MFPDAQRAVLGEQVKLLTIPRTAKLGMITSVAQMLLGRASPVKLTPVGSNCNDADDGLDTTLAHLNATEFVVTSAEHPDGSSGTDGSTSSGESSSSDADADSDSSSVLSPSSYDSGEHRRGRHRRRRRRAKRSSSHRSKHVSPRKSRRERGRKTKRRSKHRTARKSSKSRRGSAAAGGGRRDHRHYYSRRLSHLASTDEDTSSESDTSDSMQ